MTSARVSGSRNLEEDIFKLLKQRGIHLLSHVENSLKFAGYSHARTLASLDCDTGVQEIEECVTRNLAKPARLAVMNMEEKRAAFGDYFADDPEDFKFFPGERQAIRLAVDMANTIVKKWDGKKRRGSPLESSSNKRVRQSNEESSTVSQQPSSQTLPTSSAAPSSQPATPTSSATPSLPTVSQTSNSTASSLTVMQPAAVMSLAGTPSTTTIEQPLIKRGKTVDQYLFDWLERTKYAIQYDRSKCQIDLVSGIIRCICNLRKTYKMYSHSVSNYDDGYWKLPSPFIEHLRTYHKKEETMTVPTLPSPLPLSGNTGKSTRFL
jgi:hypothetical protein